MSQALFFATYAGQPSVKLGGEDTKPQTVAGIAWVGVDSKEAFLAHLKRQRPACAR